MTVKEFLDSNKHRLKKELFELRKIVKAADPKLTEQIKWNAPSFCHHGEDRITFNLSKRDAILIVLHRGAKAKPLKLNEPMLSDESNLLEWPSFDRAVMRFCSMDEINVNKKAIANIVKRWIDVTSSDSNHALSV
jgi:hypothetical protein